MSPQCNGAQEKERALISRAGVAPPGGGGCAPGGRAGTWELLGVPDKHQDLPGLSVSFPFQRASGEVILHS